MYHLQLFEAINEKAINGNYGPKPYNHDNSVNNMVKLRQNMKSSLRASSSKRQGVRPQPVQQVGKSKQHQQRQRQQQSKGPQTSQGVHSQKSRTRRLQPPSEKPANDSERRAPSATNAREKRQESDSSRFLNPNRPFLVLRTETRRKRRVRRRAINCNGALHGQCCKESFYVSFKALGWDDWIIAPRGYFANYCRGDCTGTYRTPDTFQTIHAHFIDEYRKMGLLNGMQPCCAPIKFSSMSLIYYGDEGIIKRDLPKMVVDECGCPWYRCQTVTAPTFRRILSSRGTGSITTSNSRSTITIATRDTSISTISTTTTITIITSTAPATTTTTPIPSRIGRRVEWAIVMRYLIGAIPAYIIVCMLLSNKQQNYQRTS